MTTKIDHRDKGKNLALILDPGSCFTQTLNSEYRSPTGRLIAVREKDAILLVPHHARDGIIDITVPYEAIASYVVLDD